MTALDRSTPPRMTLANAAMHASAGSRLGRALGCEADDAVEVVKAFHQSLVTDDDRAKSAIYRRLKEARELMESDRDTLLAQIQNLLTAEESLNDGDTGKAIATARAVESCLEDVDKNVDREIGCFARQDVHEAVRMMGGLR